MGIGRLFGSQHFRVLSNLTRISIVPSLLAIACSEYFDELLVPKTGSVLYLLTGTMTVIAGFQILALLESSPDGGFLPYSSSRFLSGLIETAERAILYICRIIRPFAYLMILLGGLATPIFAAFAKRNEFQEMPIALIPDSVVNLTLGNIVAVILITAITSGHRIPIYRSFKALKKFDEFLERKSKLTLLPHEVIFSEWVPSLTFYVMRILRNFGAIVFNLIVRLNEWVSIKKFLIIFRPLIVLAEFMGFAATGLIWFIHQLLIATVRWAATIMSTVLFGYFLYLNSNNFLNHIGHLSWMVALQFTGMFLATFYTFATAYLFHLDMKYFAVKERAA